MIHSFCRGPTLIFGPCTHTTQMEQTNEEAQIKTYELKSRHLVLKFKNQVSLPLAVTTMIQSVRSIFQKVPMTARSKCNNG